MFLRCVLLYVRWKVLGVQQTSCVLVRVPVWVAPVQEDEDHIPFRVCGCFQRIPWFLFFFSEFQWDLVRSLSSLHGFVISLKKTCLQRLCLSCEQTTLLRPTWPINRLGAAVSIRELLIGKSVIPLNLKVKCVFEYPWIGYELFLIPWNENGSRKLRNLFSFMILDSTLTALSWQNVDKETSWFDCLNSPTCLLFQLLYLCHMLKSFGGEVEGRGGDGPALVPSVHCEIFLLQFC